MIRRVPRLVRLDHRHLWRLLDTTGDIIEKSSKDETALLPNEGNGGGRTENAAAPGGRMLLKPLERREGNACIQSDRFAHPLLVEGRTAHQAKQ